MKFLAIGPIRVWIKRHKTIFMAGIELETIKTLRELVISVNYSKLEEEK